MFAKRINVKSFGLIRIMTFSVIGGFQESSLLKDIQGVKEINSIKSLEEPL